ncbi:hypothetical protein [Gordonia tangerina]|uniref:Restriction endonuclease subunit S n=1 Tax=Gordonia tangerina TaxID=2911060 RepID=A0ABS9DK04_9ACTN|nr:hypothetical protein [Gordonia tangerina]MCF3939560.1 hypothetical protein [Gordonia tangerina]
MSRSSSNSRSTTGISWLPEIPSHWSIEKFRYLFDESTEKNGPSPVGTMLSVSGYRGVEVKEYDDEGRRRTAEEVEDYRVVRKGQLAVNTMWLNYAGLGVSEYEGHVSPAYRAYWVSPRLHGRYANYLLRCTAYVDGYTALLTGIRPNSLQMSRNDLMGFPVIVPPMSDQLRIADFLDRETAKIDALIAKQEQLIATLHEDRIATITHAVTRGLDPSAELEATGSDVLDAIPPGWNLVSLRRVLIRIDQGVSPQASSELADLGWGVLKAGCVNGGKFEEREHKKLDADFDIDPAIVVRSGDLLVNRASGSPELVGSAAIVGELHYSLILSDKIFRLVLNDRADTHFLGWVLNCRVYRDQVKQHISGAEGLANNLPSSSLRGFRIPLPGIREQRQIADFISARTGEIDRLIKKCDSSVGLLREYRAALISDAVTGKIDVREMV